MSASPELQELADWYGVETHFSDDRGTKIEATPAALLAVLKVLGRPVTAS